MQAGWQGWQASKTCNGSQQMAQQAPAACTSHSCNSQARTLCACASLHASCRQLFATAGTSTEQTGSLEELARQRLANAAAAAGDDDSQRPRRLAPHMAHRCVVCCRSQAAQCATGEDRQPGRCHARDPCGRVEVGATSWWHPVRLSWC